MILHDCTHHYLTAAAAVRFHTATAIGIYVAKIICLRSPCLLLSRPCLLRSRKTRPGGESCMSRHIFKIFLSASSSFADGKYLLTHTIIYFWRSIFRFSVCFLFVSRYFPSRVFFWSLVCGASFTVYSSGKERRSMTDGNAHVHGGRHLPLYTWCHVFFAVYLIILFGDAHTSQWVIIQSGHVLQPCGSVQSFTPSIQITSRHPREPRNNQPKEDLVHL